MMIHEVIHERVIHERGIHEHVIHEHVINPSTTESQKWRPGNKTGSRARLEGESK